MILPAVHLGRDAPVAAALALALLAAPSGRRCRRSWTRPRATLSLRTRSPRPDRDAGRRVRGPAAAAGRAPRRTRQDGLRLALADRWVHVRPSGTEPVVRVIAEAPTGGRRAGAGGATGRRTLLTMGGTEHVRNRRIRRAAPGAADPDARGSSASSTAATTRPASRSSADGKLLVEKAAGKIAQLEAQLGQRHARRRRPASPTRAGPPTARPTSRNAHPHTDCTRHHRRGPQRHHRELRGAARRCCIAKGHALHRPRPTPRCSRT